MFYNRGAQRLFASHPAVFRHTKSHTVVLDKGGGDRAVWLPHNILFSPHKHILWVLSRVPATYVFMKK